MGLKGKKKCAHKYKYPKSMLRKDGCLMKRKAKAAAAYRKTYTQAGKLRKRKSK